MKKGKYTPPPPGSSHSNEYLIGRNTAPQVSTLMIRGISEDRRSILHDEVMEGKFRDGTGPNYNETGLTANAVVTASVGGLRKSAQVLTGGGSFGGGVSG